MKLSQKYALIASFKKWLFPPSPSPQIFLALRGTNVLGQAKDLSVSLKLGRVELKDAQLPFTEDFLGKFKEWSSGYLEYAERSRSIARTTDINPADSAATIPNISVTRKPQQTIGEQTSGSILDANTFDGVTARFERSLYDLLNNNNKFSAIRDELIRVLPAKGKSQPDIYIQYEDPHLAELPLHLWNVFQEREIEPVFSNLAAQAQKYSFNKSQKPRILLLLGDSTNLNLQRDIIIWKEQFPNAEIKDIFVKHQSDVSKILWNERWDILYFAGHSEMEDGSGKIYLSDDVSITFNDLQQGLKQSVSKGLGLAIFNSCISLGAAADLQKAGVPTIVAMRHIIHDTVAPKFLEYFLQAYLNLGKSIKNAVQIARYRLKESEEINFRCASWLPVVFQIPTIPVRPKPSPLIAIATSFIVTCFIFILHTQGLFQSAELSLYDHMMNSRDQQPLDSRIVIVQITDKDQEWMESQGEELGHESISDKYLAKLLTRLDEEKPKVIGMGLTLKTPISSSPDDKKIIDKRMLSNLKNPTLIANCSTPTESVGYFPDIMDKRSIDPKNYPWGDQRIGFTNLMPDYKFHDSLRLLPLMRTESGSKCGDHTKFSFPLRIVLNYLGIEDNDIKEIPSLGDHVVFSFNNIQISNIIKSQGGYQIDPSLSSENQVLRNRLSILFNYKNHPRHAPVSNQIFTLRQILTKKQTTSLEGKIVVIGGTSIDPIIIHSSKDNISRIDTVYIYAQAIDYLLRIFEKAPILHGIENNLYFMICLVYILCTSLSLQFIFINFENNQFFIVFSKILFDTIIVYLIHVWSLANVSLWIPSIPILSGILVSSLILSIYSQTSKKYKIDSTH